MNGLMDLVESASRALGYAVLQSLWQFALVGVVATVALMMIRRASVRYLVWCGSMLVCFGMFVMTFMSVMRPRRVVDGLIHELPMVAGFSIPMNASTVKETILFEVVAWLWVGGFVFFGLRFVNQWVAAHRIRTVGIVNIEDRWDSIFGAIRDQLGVSKRVRMFASSTVHSPMVVGWVSPMVVVPLSMLTTLREEHVRVVLVHELEHIRRYDHLVNGLQVLIETVLFYHPMVWWMSHQARLEREHCCDDAAVRWAGDARVFARALADLETTRTSSRAVLAINQGGSLMNRISRILGKSTQSRQSSAVIRTVAAMTVGALIASAGIAHAATKGDETQKSDEELNRKIVEVNDATDKQLDLKIVSVDDIQDEKSKLIFEKMSRLIAKRAELESMKRQFDGTVSTGELTQSEADELFGMIVESMDDEAVDAFSDGNLLPKAAAVLAEYGISDRVIPDVVLVMDRIIAEMIVEGDQFELHPGLVLYLNKRGLDAKTINLVTGLARQIWVEQVEHATATQVVENEIDATLSLIGECEESLQSLYQTFAETKRFVDIKIAVEEGEMTSEQAKAAYLAIRNEQQVGLNNRIEEYIASFDLQIHELVETGEMSAEDAKARMAEARKSIEQRVQWASMENEIIEAVNSGKLTREEGLKNLSELRSKREAVRNNEWQAVRDRIEGAVKRGQMTRMDAKRAYEQARDQLYPSQEKIDKVIYDQNGGHHLGVMPYIEGEDLDC
ncbi:MAG: M56 family metallopeptidase [Phycisphaerales bacterium]|nr:M56 family metallopeptidase [Phycisphaerales bacterium]